MAWTNRLWGDGGIFHLTPRGHSQAFRLKFARHRDVSAAKVRKHMRQTLIVFRRGKMLQPADEVWLLQEAVISYGQKARVKNAARALI